MPSRSRPKIGIRAKYPPTIDTFSIIAYSIDGMSEKASQIRDVRITASALLLSPSEMEKVLPISGKAAATVRKGRREIQDILGGKDGRFLVIAGPCSIHDPAAAVDYARRLAELRARYADRMCIAMRVYFEKPRTALGWRGLILDPALDGTADIARGLRLAREILIKVNEAGVPAGSEMLDPIIPQYIADLTSWASIGARTVGSQTHRELASGLSMPVGFKNPIDGDIQVAVNVIVSARRPHAFIGITQEGKISIMRTLGNPDGHLILRGGKGGPNYDEGSVKEAAALMEEAGLRPSIIVDCSHGNARKIPENQIDVLYEAVRARGEAGLPARQPCGCMIESNIETGRQDIPSDPAALKYGLSVTDSCLGWDLTASALAEAYKFIGETQ